MDRIDDFVYKQIQERKDTKEPYESFFNRIYGIELSNTEARKELRGIENHLEYKKEHESEINDEENNMPRYKESTEFMPDGSYKSDKLLRMSAEESKDVNYLLKAHGFDNKYWEIINARNNIWNVYSKQDGVQQLYSSKITVKPIVLEYDIEWAKEVFKEIQPLPPVKSYKNNKGKKIVELQYADIHIGLRGCEYEEELKQMTDRIISKFKDVDIFILPIGQDFLNSNNVNGALSTTVKGTPVEQSLKYKEMFKSGLRVISYIIDRIIEENPKAKIECIYVPGNHDSQSCFGVFQSIMQRYSKNENIIFDDEIEPRKYRLYGVNAIGFGHGQDEGKRIFGAFPVEAPEIFAKAKYREFHLSHLHNESVRDENGVIFRRMPTVNNPDNWHTDKCFVGATKRIQAFVYDSEVGLEEIKYFYL